MKVQLHDEAKQDIDDAALWYEGQEPGLGEEFLADLGHRLAGLIAVPEAWPVWPRSRRSKYPVRKRLLARFPYAIAYQVVGETIVVVAVAAHKRRPRYWASRVR